MFIDIFSSRIVLFSMIFPNSWSLCRKGWTEYLSLFAGGLQWTRFRPVHGTHLLWIWRNVRQNGPYSWPCVSPAWYLRQSLQRAFWAEVHAEVQLCSWYEVSFLCKRPESSITIPTHKSEELFIWKIMQYWCVIVLFWIIIVKIPPIFWNKRRRCPWLMANSAYIKLDILSIQLEWKWCFQIEKFPSQIIRW